jgi:hypothetical protein
MCAWGMYKHAHLQPPDFRYLLQLPQLSGHVSTCRHAQQYVHSKEAGCQCWGQPAMCFPSSHKQQQTGGMLRMPCMLFPKQVLC